MKIKFKYRKILKYLTSKEKNNYNNLDLIFQFFIDEQLTKIMNNCHFSKIECFFQVSKKGNYLQTNFWYYNLVVTAEFHDFNYEYCIYLPGMTAYQVDESFVNNNYAIDFDIEQFFNNLRLLLENDNRLIKN